MKKETASKTSDQVKNSSGYQGVVKDIERREQLQDQLNNSTRKEGSLQTRIHSLKSRSIEANGAVGGYEAGYKRTQRQDDKNKLDLAIEKQNQAKSELDSAMLELESIKSEQKKINSELLALNVLVNESVLDEHQNNIAEVTQQISLFNDLIADQQAIISDCSNVDNGTASLKQNRQDVLTDIAMGDDKSEELQEIDKQIAIFEKQAAKTQTSNQKSILDAQETIAGLSVRKAKAESMLSTLNHRTPHLLGQFIKDMAFVELEKYKKAAENITVIVETIKHLDSLMITYGDCDETGVMNVNRWNMRLPRFNGMTAIEGTPDTEHFYADINNHTVFSQKNLEAIKLSIKDKGINL